MGMFDTMNQMGKPTPTLGQPIGQAQPNAMGQGFAQQKPMAMQQKPMMAQQSMQKNKSMNVPQAGNVPSNWGNVHKQYQTPLSGQRSATTGSRTELANRLREANNAHAIQQGAPIAGSYNQLLSNNPTLQENRQTGMNAGQDMSWMDKPGALTMPSQHAPAMNSGYGQPQSGLSPLQSPLDAQRQQEQLQTQQQAAMNPMARAAEQMRGYDGPDMGSQDPRELARIGQAMGQPYGEVGRPDVMDRGIGPSNPMEAMQAMGQPMQMDENGMEPRRGAR